MKQEEKIKTATKLLASFRSGDSLKIDDEIMDLFKLILDVLEYQTPMTVTEYIIYKKSINGFSEAFDICPRCKSALSRSYQDCCSNCGQHLKWICPRKYKTLSKEDN